MVYYPPRSTSQNQHYNTQNPRHDSRGAYPSQTQERVQRSHSPLPRPPIGLTPTSRAPSPAPPRPLPRAQTYPSGDQYTHGNIPPRHSEGRKLRGNPEPRSQE
ncbi:hypothetical protein EAE96_003071 [Botrytis aclada]|nr:hypothetical protein EAE96_003071 [Botrytis aclada]